MQEKAAWYYVQPFELPALLFKDTLFQTWCLKLMSVLFSLCVANLLDTVPVAIL